MPVTLPPISRRGFLRGAVGATGVTLLGARAWGENAPVANDPNHLALLSDIHIAADKSHDPRKQGAMWDRLLQVREQLLALKDRPSAVLVNGDCAFHSGMPRDYAALVEGLKPLRQAGLPVHLGLGNHDSRANLQEALPADVRVVAGGFDRRVMRLPLGHADWYMLDSLLHTSKVPGALGSDQLAWLGKTLEAHKERPAIVMVHHQPDQRPIEHASGLTDTAALLDVIKPRKQVKALLFGHTHIWKHYERDGLHFVNLPTTAYVFKAEEPLGWVQAWVEPQRMKLKLHALVANGAKDEETLELAWR